MLQPPKHAGALVALAIAACVLMLGACGSAGKPTRVGTNAAAAFLRFSECMRSHGVPNFPDPSPGGGIDIGSGSGLDPRSPTFQSGQHACKHLLPGGGPPAHVPESAKLAMLRHAACMRAHGIPDYPDPRFPRGGGIESFIGPAVNPNAPAFQTAAKACGGD